MSLAPSPAALLVAVLAAAFVSELGAQTVQRRDGAEPLVAVRVDLRPEGVFCERETGATQLVPWDRVRSIEGSDDPALLEAWSRKRPVAEDLWRARARIQRGDARLAEPLLERHVEPPLLREVVLPRLRGRAVLAACENAARAYEHGKRK